VDDSEDAGRGSDDLWPPFGPAWPPDRGARSHQLQRERARGQDARGQDARGQGGSGQGGRDQRGRGRSRQHPSLSRGEIVDAAIAIADADGADAVSMRRIAQVLRSGTMSLYWHVASKEHLLELMLDTMLAEVDVPEPTGDWQADLRAQARSTRSALLRHRWVIDFIGTRPSFGPNTLRNLDRSLATLGGLDIDTATAINVLQTVSTYVSGAVLREFQEIRVQREQEKFDVDGADFAAGFAAWREKLAATGQFDHFLRILNDKVDPDAEGTRDERFEFGLDCVLDGIAAKVAPGAPRGPLDEHTDPSRR
jgi:AcrR family transcriptional regulator